MFIMFHDLKVLTILLQMGSYAEAIKYANEVFETGTFIFIALLVD